MQFHVLGQLQVVRDGRPLELGSRKQRVLLAALLLERGRAVPVGRLVDLLWGEQPPDSAEAGLHSYVSRLRRVLEPDRSQRTAPEVLVTRGAGYALLVRDEHLDAAAFERRAAQAGAALRAQRWDEAAEHARRARDLWRGPLLPELADVPFTLAEARRLEALLGGCREALVVSALARGDLVAPVAEAERWVDAAPDDEHALWLLVLSLHRAGRTAEGLDRLRAHRQRLADATGLEVGRDLSALQASLLAQDPALDLWPLTAAASVQRDEPVQQDRQAGSLPVQRAPEPAAPVLGDLLGREAELAVLRRALTGARDAAQWVVLTGTAGIGKTSLAAALVDGAERAVWSRCPDDTVPAWWPLRQLVRHLGEAPEALLVPPPGTDADAARFLVYERVAALLLAARPAGGVLAAVVDDVQWADETSLSCLAYLADAVADEGLLLVLTLRDDEVPRPAVQRLLAVLARRQRTWRVPVPPLSSAAVGEVVERLTGKPVPPADAALLTLRTGGNPLFVGEYARLPDAERRDGRVPVAARELLQRRLARLPDAVVDVLRTAAVVGEDFDLATVAAATGLTTAELADRLDTAAAAQVVVAGRAGGTAYGFAHGLLRDAVLAGLTAPRRQLLHARTAAVLAGRGDAEGLARRAGHLLSAGPVADPDEVRAACLDVARDAARRQEPSVAAQWYEAALDVVPESPHRLELEVAAVRALSWAGRPDRAVQRVDAAIACAVGARDSGAAARLADELVHVQDGWMWTVFGEPRPALLDRLVEALVLTDDPACRVPLLAAVAAGLHAFTRVEERLSYADEAIRLAERSPDVALRRSAYGGALRALMHTPRQLELAQSVLDALRECLDPVPDRVTVFESQTRADQLLLRGRVLASRAVHERTIALSDALRLPGYRSQQRWAATQYAQWAGDLEHAERLADRALQVHQQTGVQYAAGGYAQSLLSLRRLQGRTAEVDDQHLELTRGYNHELWQALRAYEVGDLGAARRWVDQVPRELQHWWGMLSSQVLLAHAVCDLEVVDRAQEAYDDLAESGGLVAVFGHFGMVGPVDLALGRLLLLLGRPDEAVERLRAARALAVREGGRPFVEHAERLLAPARA